MTNICLTLDYELFGSGKGDVFHHIIEPTNRLLDICNLNGLKLTIFFEVVEYWKIKENYESGNSMGYEKNPAVAMEEQITRAYHQGHDIQLHLHPQWVDARYEEGEWILNQDYWRLPEVPTHPNKNISMGLSDLIGKGKQTLEGLLQPLNPNYQCNIFRAGGYNIDPSQELIEVLHKHEFIMDTSVFSFGEIKSELSRYDYSKVTDQIPYWFSSRHSLLEEAVNEIGLIEIPLFAQKIPRITKYDLVRLKTAMKNRVHAVDKFRNSSAKKTKWETLQFFLEKESVIWDFCLFSSRKMKRYMRRAQRVEKNSSFAFHPFVLVGHAKDFQFPDAIQWLMKNTRKYKMNFLTLTECADKIQEESGESINQARTNYKIS